jgi:hypothetical protein
MLTVLQAAISVGDGIVTAPKPARHGDIIRIACRMGAPYAAPDEQGFLLSDGTFATRERAWQVAHEAAQPILRWPEIQAGDYLFSEDLW